MRNKENTLKWTICQPPNSFFIQFGRLLTLLVLDFGGHHHRHTPSKHQGLAFEFALSFQLLDDLIHDPVAIFHVHHLAAAKQHRKLNLMPFFEKFSGMLDLNIAVMDVNFRPQSNLLQRHRMLLFLAQFNLALLLIQVLTVIHNPAHWRLGIRRHLHKVQPQVVSLKLGLFHINNTHLIVIFID